VKLAVPTVAGKDRRVILAIAHKRSQIERGGNDLAAIRQPQNGEDNFAGGGGDRRSISSKTLFSRIKAKSRGKHRTVDKTSSLKSWWERRRSTGGGERVEGPCRDHPGGRKKTMTRACNGCVSTARASRRQESVKPLVRHPKEDWIKGICGQLQEEGN